LEEELARILRDVNPRHLSLPPRVKGISDEAAVNRTKLNTIWVIVHELNALGPASLLGEVKGLLLRNMEEA
jgi:hypothetical protein